MFQGLELILPCLFIDEGTNTSLPLIDEDESPLIF